MNYCLIVGRLTPVTLMSIREISLRLIIFWHDTRYRENRNKLNRKRCTEYKLFLPYRVKFLWSFASY